MLFLPPSSLGFLYSIHGDRALSHAHTSWARALDWVGGGLLSPPFLFLAVETCLRSRPGLGWQNGLWLLRRGLFLLFAGKFLLNTPLVRVYLLFRSVRVSESIFSTKLIRDIFETMLELVI